RISSNQGKGGNGDENRQGRCGGAGHSPGQTRFRSGGQLHELPGAEFSARRKQPEPTTSALSSKSLAAHAAGTGRVEGPGDEARTNAEHANRNAAGRGAGGIGQSANARARHAP